MSAIAQPATAQPRASRRLDIVERPAFALNGFLVLVAALTLLVLGGYLVYSGVRPAIATSSFGQVLPSFGIVGCGAVILLAGLVTLGGLTVVAPNVAVVTTWFGSYTGTLSRNGFWWINPFCKTQEVSLALQAIENKFIKVNDFNGNPIEIGAVVNWGVEDAAKAVLNVTDYSEYVALQVETAIRTIATMHPYETFQTFDDDGKLVTTEADRKAPLQLRGHSEEISQALADLIDTACAQAGIRVSVARISHLAYAPEIAPAMLKRQQVDAVSQARATLVRNIIAIARNASNEVERGVDGKQGIKLDPERKAAFICNLAVVLASEREATPVVNVGSLHSV